MAQTDPAEAALRRFSKEILSRSYRLETAAAIGRLESPWIHASLVSESLGGRVPFNKVSDELNVFAAAGLLRRVEGESRNTIFEIEPTTFFDLAAALEAEVRKRQ